MDINKRQRLEAAGWCVGTPSEFLKLSSVEAEIVELKLALSQRVKEIRESHHLSQKALAKKMESSQSRVAKIEAGDPSVSLDLILRALFSSGATRSDLANVISSSESNKENSCELVIL
jgi:DNA-binding XRE family transcriptional regulator